MPKNSLNEWIDSHSIWLCIGITLVGAFLRLYQLGSRSLWFDEAIEVLIAREPLAQIQSTALFWQYTDPPIFSWLLHFILKLSSSEAILRLPSAAIGVFAVYASYHLFRLWVDSSTALIAQAFIALAPAQVYYSQEVNQYAFAVAFAVLILWAFEKAVRQTTRRNAIVFGIVGAIGIWITYSLVFLLAGLAIVVLFRQKPRDWLQWLPAIIIIGVSSLALFFLVIYAQYQRNLSNPAPPMPALSEILTITGLTSAGMSLMATVRLFTDFSGGFGGLGNPVNYTTWIFVVLFLIGVVGVLRRSDWQPVAGALFVCIVLCFAGSELGIYFWGWRYLLFLSPLFYLITAIGSTLLAKTHAVFTVAMPVILVFLCFNQIYPGWQNGDAVENLRPIVRTIQQKAEPSDGIYVYYGARPAFAVYYSGPMDEVRLGKGFRNKPLQEKMTDIYPFLETHPHAWFVASHMIVSEVNDILQALDQRCQRTMTLNESNAMGVRYDCAAAF